MALLDGTAEDFIDGIFEGLSIPSTPPSIPGTGSSLAAELRTPEGMASADEVTIPATATAATQTNTPLTQEAGTQTSTDAITKLTELVKQGPQAVDDGLKHLDPTVQTAVRQAAAQLQELRERAQAAGSQEQPRRQKQTPTPPVKTPPTGKHQTMMQQPTPKPPPSQQQVEARYEGWEDAADKARATQMGFSQPAAWQAFKERHPQAKDLPYRLATSPIQPAGPPPTTAKQPPAEQPAPTWPRTKAAPTTKQPPRSISKAAPAPPHGPTPAKATQGQGHTTTTTEPQPEPPAQQQGTQPADEPNQDTPATTSPQQGTTAGYTETDSQGAQPPQHHTDDDQIVQWNGDLSYGDDRRLRWSLQRPGAEVPTNQYPPPPMRPLACEDMQDLVGREEATVEGTPMPYIDGAAYWFIMKLPRDLEPPRIPLNMRSYRLVGWCGHPCSNDQCEGHYRRGPARCLRPVFSGYHNRRPSHWCNLCHAGRQ